MPPLTDIVWNIADSERVNGIAFSAVTAPAGPGVLSCAVYSPPSGDLVLIADSFPPSMPPEDFSGYNDLSGLGSLTPDTYGGQTIGAIFAGISRFGLNQSVLRFNATGLAQSFFTTITINGVTLASADAGFTDNGTICVWSWLGDAFYFVPDTYTVEFT